MPHSQRDNNSSRWRILCAITTFILTVAWCYFTLLPSSPSSTHLPSPSPLSLSSASVDSGSSADSQLPIVCSHRMSPFPLPPAGSSHPVGALLTLSRFVSSNGVRCFDLDLFESKDGVILVGAAKDLLFAIGMNQTETSDATEMELFTAEEIRKNDPLLLVPTLNELLDFLVLAPYDAPPTVPTDAAAAPSPPRVFVTLEPKPLALRTQARLEGILRMILAHSALTNSVVLIIHEPHVAQAIRATRTTAVPPLPRLKNRQHVTASPSPSSYAFSKALLALPLFDRLPSDAAPMMPSAELEKTSTSIAVSIRQGSATEEICSHDVDTYPLAHRLELIAPYDLIMASYRIVHACGSVKTFAATQPAMALSRVRSAILICPVAALTRADKAIATTASATSTSSRVNPSALGFKGMFKA